jgi:hypothetical protein
MFHEEVRNEAHPVRRRARAGDGDVDHRDRRGGPSCVEEAPLDVRTSRKRRRVRSVALPGLVPVRRSVGDVGLDRCGEGDRDVPGVRSVGVSVVVSSIERLGLDCDGEALSRS